MTYVYDKENKIIKNFNDKNEEQYLKIGNESVFLKLYPNNCVFEIPKGTYSKGQLIQLILGIRDNLDIDYYFNVVNSSIIMNEIRLGLEEGIDVSYYSNEEYNYKTMKRIRKAILELKDKGIDLFDFKGKRKEIIKDGLRYGIDVYPLCNEDINNEKAKELFIGLISNVDLTKYLYDFNGKQLREIRLGLMAGLDVEEYANTDLNEKQMKEIREGIKEGLDVSLYKNPMFDYLQMREIKSGLKKGIDVTKYAKPIFTTFQMREIADGLVKGVEVGLYASIVYNSNQMCQIKLALEDGLDVTTMLDPKLSHEEMRKMRKILAKESPCSKTTNFTEEELNIIRFASKAGVNVDELISEEKDVKKIINKIISNLDWTVI